MNELNPKFQVGQQVEAVYNSQPNERYMPATIRGVKIVYQVAFDTFFPTNTYDRSESQIREPRPSEEEAWEKATMLIGQRSQAHWGYSNEAWDKETRHQVYKILGSAGIKIEPEVKTDVMRLIGIANAM